VFATEIAVRKAIAKFYHSEQVVDDGAEDWRAWDQMPQVQVSRFSDRFTKTREHEFDTQEMISRNAELGVTFAAEAADDAATAEGGEAGAVIERLSSRPATRPPPTRPPAAPEPRATPIALPATEVLQPAAVGATIAARYRLEALLGQGGMATVFRARDWRSTRTWRSSCSLRPSGPSRSFFGTRPSSRSLAS